MLRRMGLLAVLGGSLGTVLDFAHVHTGAIAYTTPVVVEMAWWVPIVYVNAALSIGLSHPWLDARLGSRRPAPSVLEVVLGMAGFAAIWVASGVFAAKDPRVVGAFLAPASIALWAALDRTRAGALLAVATAIGGFVAEQVLIRLGLFRYLNPDLLGVASWLPWLYVAASVAVGNLGRFVADNASIVEVPQELSA